MISKLVIIRVKAVTLSQPSWCVSWPRRTEGNLRYERRVRESFIMKTEDGEKRKEVCRGDTS